MAAAAEVVGRCEARQLMALYKLPAFDGADALLRQLALARGKLRKGGLPDMEVALTAHTCLLHASLPLIVSQQPGEATISAGMQCQELLERPPLTQAVARSLAGRDAARLRHEPGSPGVHHCSVSELSLTLTIFGRPSDFDGCLWIRWVVTCCSVRQAAARMLLHAWNDGRISYYTLPPKRADHGHAAAAIVPAYAADFNVDEART